MAASCEAAVAALGATFHTILAPQLYSAGIRGIYIWGYRGKLQSVHLGRVCGTCNSCNCRTTSSRRKAKPCLRKGTIRVMRYSVHRGALQVPMAVWTRRSARFRVRSLATAGLRDKGCANDAALSPATSVLIDRTCCMRLL